MIAVILIFMRGMKLVQKNQSQGTKSHYGGTFSHRQVLYTSLYRLFKAQQIILYEISSIAEVNNELCGRQGKWGE